MNKLFKPIRVNKTMIKNRFVVSAMVVCYVGEDGNATERYIAYHETKAKGGWGLIITEDYEVAQDVGGFYDLPGLWNNEQIESHRCLTERVHKHGAKIIAQIYHAGRETTSDIMGREIVGPSPVKDPTMSEVPRELTIEEIQTIVTQFGDCAVRAQKAGFDGVEIHGAHGYLIGSFASAFSNKRTDDYGGTIERRAKLAADVINEVRRRTGEDFIISYRMSVAEYVPGGIDVEEAKVIAQIAEEAGADVIHCSQGVYTTTQNIIAPAVTPRAAFAENAQAVRKAVNVPVIAVGRINDPLIAQNIINEDRADMVTMARASLADPYLPAKTRSGDREDIIRCIGCNQGCIGMNAVQKPVRCMVNPLTGMEYKYDFKKVEHPKKVYVAGGGVSGCEAAIVAAMRGHKVTLFEKNDRLGGQWLAAAVPLGKGEFTSFVVWQQQKLVRSGVRIRLNTELTEAIVAEEMPDVVVIATGSQPKIINIKGSETANIVTVHDVLLGRTPVGDKALVIGGGAAGCETADHIAYHGCGEVIVTEITDIIASDMPAAPKKFLLERMENSKVQIYKKTEVKKINGRNVVLENKQGGEIHLENVDTIILAAGMRENRELEEKLNALQICPVVSVGDSSSVKDGYLNIQEAFDRAYIL